MKKPAVLLCLACTLGFACLLAACGDSSSTPAAEPVSSAAVSAEDALVEEARSVLEEQQSLMTGAAPAGSADASAFDAAADSYAELLSGELASAPEPASAEDALAEEARSVLEAQQSLMAGAAPEAAPVGSADASAFDAAAGSYAEFLSGELSSAS